MTKQNGKWSESPIHDQVKRAGLDNAGEAQALSALSGSLDVLIEKWEACAKSWMKLADERSEDPDLADRAAARAAIYQDCANDLKENV